MKKDKCRCEDCFIGGGFITLLGTPQTHWDFPGRVGDRVTLEREHNNEYDDEAIAVFVKGCDKIGYVANSTKTVIHGTSSAGRIYDKIAHRHIAEVVFKLPDGKAIAKLRSY